MVRRGRSVNGTRYNNAGCAALNTSLDTVAVNNPVITHRNIQETAVETKCQQNFN